ncbi:MAG: GTPase ObgE [bacterium]
MRFIDQVKILVRSGAGGAGCVAFRREKYIPKGGPSGGDGGKGGDIIIQADSRINTLVELRYQVHYFAERGKPGRGSDRHGKSASDTIIKVPLGTTIKIFETGETIGDLLEEGQELLAAAGGRGGRGNARFATSTNQAPRYAEPGEESQEIKLQLDLKLIADVGLLGFPNAGKSTLISRVSSARPQVADYPFTTLVPQLGVVRTGNYRSFVMADLPGLIKGAHEGVGLGFRFLRHLERTRLLVHLVDVSSFDETGAVQRLEIINNELQLYSRLLTEKPQIIVASKCDAAGAEEKETLKTYCRETGLPFLEISSVTGQGLSELIKKIAHRLE